MLMNITMIQYDCQQNIPLDEQVLSSLWTAFF